VRARTLPVPQQDAHTGKHRRIGHMHRNTLRSTRALHPSSQSLTINSHHDHRPH